MPNKPATGADATRRAARTLFQIGTVTALIQVYNLFSARPLTADQTSAVTVVGTLIITFAQNLLEEQGNVPTMLKGKPDAPLTIVGGRPNAALAEADLRALLAELQNTRTDAAQRNQRPTTEREAFIERFRG